MGLTQTLLTAKYVLWISLVTSTKSTAIYFHLVPLQTIIIKATKIMDHPSMVPQMEGWLNSTQFPRLAYSRIL